MDLSKSFLISYQLSFDGVKTNEGPFIRRLFCASVNVVVDKLIAFWSSAFALILLILLP